MRSDTLKELMGEELPNISYQRKLSYRPTIREVRSLFRLINKEVFYDKLPMPKIVIRPRLRGSWGDCVGEHIPFKKGKSRCIITLADRWFCKQWLIATLAHEMVHQYQWDIYSEIRIKKGLDSIMSHGPSFYIFKEKLRKKGIPLKDSHGISKWFKYQDLFRC